MTLEATVKAATSEVLATTLTTTQVYTKFIYLFILFLIFIYFIVLVFRQKKCLGYKTPIKPFDKPAKALTAKV